MKQKGIYFLLAIAVTYCMSITGSGCAQIGVPTGGPKDTLAPVLQRSVPQQRNINFTGNRITLNFDEYVEVQEAQTNVLMSPLQKTNPQINYALRTISIKIKDTLKPNTTYSINFGNAIRDVNEGNVFKEFTYVFSTGNTIDSLALKGHVNMAETGAVDSTMLVLLYRNAHDSSVKKDKPDYVAKVNGQGNFTLKYLPAGRFKLYALRDGDGSKTYNSKSEVFAFRQDNEDIILQNLDTSESFNLLAYADEKVTQQPNAVVPPKAPLEKKLRYAPPPNKQDLLTPLDLAFNNPVTIDTQKIYLADTSYNRLSNARLTLDSTKRILSVIENWKPETAYILIVQSDAAKDSLNNALAKTDTFRFTTKRNEDYGKVVLRFSNLNLAKHPVLQILEGEKIKSSYPLTSLEWTNQLFPTGEFGIRILYDTNSNGVWDPGNYDKKLQPESTITMPQKLAVRANWENEREIKL